MVVCMQSLSCTQWLQRYMYMPLSKRTCATGHEHSHMKEVGSYLSSKKSISYIVTMYSFCSLPYFQVVRIVGKLPNVFVNRNALIAHRKSGNNTGEGHWHGDEACNNCQKQPTLGKPDISNEGRILSTLSGNVGWKLEPGQHFQQVPLHHTSASHLPCDQLAHELPLSLAALPHRCR